MEQQQAHNEEGELLLVPRAKMELLLTKLEEFQKKRPSQHIHRMIQFVRSVLNSK